MKFISNLFFSFAKPLKLFNASQKVTAVLVRVIAGTPRIAPRAPFDAIVHQNIFLYEVHTPKLFDKVARKWGVDYAIRRVGDQKYLLLFKARQADAITGCFAEYSRLELKRAKSRQTPIREQLRQAEEQVKKQPQRELTKEAAHGDR